MDFVRLALKIAEQAPLLAAAKSKLEVSSNGLAVNGSPSFVRLALKIPVVAKPTRSAVHLPSPAVLPLFCKIKLKTFSLQTAFVPYLPPEAARPLDGAPVRSRGTETVLSSLPELTSQVVPRRLVYTETSG